MDVLHLYSGRNEYSRERFSLRSKIAFAVLACSIGGYRLVYRTYSIWVSFSKVFPKYTLNKTNISEDLNQSNHLYFPVCSSFRPAPTPLSAQLGRNFFALAGLVGNRSSIDVFTSLHPPSVREKNLWRQASTEILVAKYTGEPLKGPFNVFRFLPTVSLLLHLLKLLHNDRARNHPQICCWSSRTRRILVSILASFTMHVLRFVQRQPAAFERLHCYLGCRAQRDVKEMDMIAYWFTIGSAVLVFLFPLISFSNVVNKYSTSLYQRYFSHLSM